MKNDPAMAGFFIVKKEYMAHRIENKLKQQNPEFVTGVDIKKVNDAVGTITHAVGQRGHTVVHIDVSLCTLFSQKEARTLAHKLSANHRLRIVDAKVESSWRHNDNRRASTTEIL